MATSMITSSSLGMHLLNNVEKARQTERLQLRFNIPNIPENKRYAEQMLKQSLGFFKALPTSIQHRYNICLLYTSDAADE